MCLEKCVRKSLKMAKSTTLLRHYIIPRPSRRHVSSTSGLRSTSPQRHVAAATERHEAPAAKRLRPFVDVPGPLALPMLRHSAHVLPRIGNFHHTVGLGLLERLRERYGDLVRLAKASRKRPVLYVFDPEMMREVYESGVTQPPRWEPSPLSLHRKSAPGICPMQGDESKAIWLAIRALLQDGSLLKSYDNAFDDIAKDATRRLGDLRHAENALNEELETEVYRWALETVGMMIFGIRLGCLDGDVHMPTAENRNPEKTSMDDEAKEQCSLSKRCVKELNPAERLVRCTREIADGSYLVRSENTLKTDSETFNNALKAFDNHFSLTEHFLQRALAELSSNNLKPEQVLIDKLKPLDRRILPLAADVLLAGVEPLVHTALSMFYHLSLHAACQQRAHDELLWAAASAGAGAPRPDTPYIAACAQEVMRLHPVTGGVVRRSMGELALGGFEIPAGVDIVLAHGVTSKLEKEWGRARAFVPSRWCGGGAGGAGGAAGGAGGGGPLSAARAHPLAARACGEACVARGVAGRVLAALAARVLDKYRLEWHGPAPNIVTTGVNRLQPPYYLVLQDAA